jgi:hypothetical protein
MIRYLSPIIVCFFWYSAGAQIGRKNSFNVSVGADMVFPRSSFASDYNFGPGGTVKAEYVFAKHISVTAAGSLYHFRAEKGQSFQLFPLQGGLRYYVGNFYLAAEAGTAFGRNTNGFIYAFSLGDEIITSKNGNSLDVSFRYQNWDGNINAGFYGVRVAYEFRIR